MQAFEKGIKQHFDKCTGAPSRPRRNPDAGLKDVIRVDEEEDEADDDEQQVTKLVRNRMSVRIRLAAPVAHG